jgi:hypothetical protein
LSIADKAISDKLFDRLNETIWQKEIKPWIINKTTDDGINLCGLMVAFATKT